MTRQALFKNVHQSDPLEFWSNHGLDYKRVTDFLNLNASELSKIGGVSKRSVRLDDRIPQALKIRLEQIANICALVAELFEGDIEKTALWFKMPNPMLGDISPRDMIRYGRYKRLIKFIAEAQEARSPSTRSTMMISEIEQHRQELRALCQEYDVERLALFGSAATGSSRVNSSDLDFLVEFRTPSASGYANRYFGLLEGLQNIFKRPVDLVVESAIKNPYFREAVNREKALLYAA